MKITKLAPCKPPPPPQNIPHRTKWGAPTSPISQQQQLITVGASAQPARHINLRFQATILHQRDRKTRRHTTDFDLDDSFISFLPTPPVYAIPISPSNKKKNTPTPPLRLCLEFVRSNSLAFRQPQNVICYKHQPRIKEKRDKNSDDALSSLTLTACERLLSLPPASHSHPPYVKSTCLNTAWSVNRVFLVSCTPVPAFFFSLIS